MVAALFYVLGSSYILAYILWTHGILDVWCAWWLAVVDVPLIAMGLLFAGMSLYKSVSHPSEPSKTLAYVIGSAVLLLFLCVLTLNYWEVLGLPVIPKA